MAIPVVYNFRSVRARWTSAIVAVAGIAGTVGVFVAMLSLARGFRATLVSSGSEDNAIVMRAGATSEMMSGVDLDAVTIIQNAPGVARVLDDVYKRPTNVFQSITVHLTAPQAFQQFKDSVTSDPRLNVQVSREIDYYAKQSRTMTTLITVLGGLVAGVMAIGAIFGALNTMYSAVSERSREIATMRALGFAGPSVVISFLIEALFVSFVGGALGCPAALPLNGLTTGAMKWQTFTQLAFAFALP